MKIDKISKALIGLGASVLAVYSTAAVVLMVNIL